MLLVDGRLPTDPEPFQALAGAFKKLKSDFSENFQETLKSPKKGLKISQHEH